MKWVDSATKGELKQFNCLIGKQSLIGRLCCQLWLTPEFPDYELPSAHNSPTIPHSQRTPVNSPKHKLAQFTRLFLLHELSLLPTAHAETLFSPARLAQTEADLDASGHPGVREGLPPRARLYGPKVLAMPTYLSMDEYASVVNNMIHGLESVAPGAGERAWKWRALLGLAPLVVAVSAKRGGVFPFEGREV